MLVIIVRLITEMITRIKTSTIYLIWDQSAEDNGDK